jgi:hypothetical protein
VAMRSITAAMARCLNRWRAHWQYSNSRLIDSTKPIIGIPPLRAHDRETVTPKPPQTRQDRRTLRPSLSHCHKVERSGAGCRVWCAWRSARPSHTALWRSKSWTAAMQNHFSAKG